MQVYQSRFLLRGEVWYDQQPDPTPVDWIFYRQRSRPVPGAKWRLFYTILLDLCQSPEVLRQQLSKSTAYKIRRARDKDGILCEHLNPVTGEILDAFEETYKRFAALKGLPPLDRERLDLLAEDGCLELTSARDPDGKPLVYNGYYRDASRSCMLHTVSLYQMLSDSAARNAVGRANRYLFWTDILRHQEQGLRHFDFGGWYPGRTDQELLDINRFKEGFGGQVVREYNCEQILTAKALVVLKTAAVLGAGKRFLAKLKAHPRSRKPDTSGTDSELHSPSDSAGNKAPALQAAEVAR
jgi:hypothetical protein